MHVIAKTSTSLESIMPSNNKLLAIYPEKLRFPSELKKQSFCSLYLTNKTNNHVAFKVKTTNPRNYGVKPNFGVVLPRSTCEVVVTMPAQEEAPSDMQCKDKFLIRAVRAVPSVTREEVTEEMFSQKAGRLVEETKLEVAFVVSTGTKQYNNELLTVEPLELKFPAVSMKKMSHYIFLTNKKDITVAYKVIAINSRNHHFPSGKGVVHPNSTLSLIVTMQAQEEAPSTMQGKDKFIVQAIASPGIKEEEVTYEMFLKKARDLVEETTLRVTYVTNTITSSPRYQPLVRIYPQELVYHLVSSRKMPQYLSLENKSDNDVAIKVTSENPSNYFAGLGKDLIRPRSTNKIKVVLRAGNYDTRFKDKIIVQAVTVSPIQDKKDVTEEMFSKEAGHLVEETTLNVKFYDSDTCIIL